MKGKVISDLVKWFDNSKTEALKKSLEDTNTVLDVFSISDIRISSKHIQLIKDCAVVLDEPINEVAIIFSRYGNNTDKLQVFCRYGFVSSKEITLAKEAIDDFDPWIFIMSRLNENYGGCYNKSYSLED